MGELIYFSTIDDKSPTSHGHLPYTCFFYKNKLYKNTQAEICPKIKNKPRTITRLKFRSCSQIENTVHILLLELARSSGAGSLSDKYNIFKYAHDIRRCCLDGFMFFTHCRMKPKQALISYSYSTFLLFQATNALFGNIQKYEQFKNNLRLKSTKN